MFELWARKWPVNGRGFPYELVTSFDREEQKFYMVDRLDKSVWKEAMVLDDNKSAILFREFEKPKTKKIGTKEQ
jgi:hypothetical protein